MTPPRHAKILDHGFKLSLYIKAFDGIIEILGAAVFIGITPKVINQFLLTFASKELTKDPQDIFANFVLQATSHMSLDVQTTLMIYLLIHGISKLLIVYCLLIRVKWAYPLAIALLITFSTYQFYKYYLSHALIMLVLAVFDLLMCLLVYREYRSLTGRNDL